MGGKRKRESEKLIEANEAACKMTGYTQDELLTMLPADLNSEETIQQSAEGVEKLLKTDRQSLK
jgi:PAS domain S-box-containing protein